MANPSSAVPVAISGGKRAPAHSAADNALMIVSSVDTDSPTYSPVSSVLSSKDGLSPLPPADSSHLTPAAMRRHGDLNGSGRSLRTVQSARTFVSGRSPMFRRRSMSRVSRTPGSGKHLRMSMTHNNLLPEATMHRNLLDMQRMVCTVAVYCVATRLSDRACSRRSWRNRCATTVHSEAGTAR